MENADRGLVPVLQLQRAVSATFSRSRPLNLELGPGLHALVGVPDSGLCALAPLVSGVERVRMGSVRVLGCDPSSTPSLRARIGATMREPLLPPGRTVADVIRMVRDARLGVATHARAAQGAQAAHPSPTAQAAHPSPTAQAAHPSQPLEAVRPAQMSQVSPTEPGPLERFHLQHWVKRRLSSLSPLELRVLDLALAISTPEPVALVLTEPGLAADAIDRDALRQSLLRAAERGACVVVATASIQDALDFGHWIHLVEEGSIVRSVVADRAGDLVPGRPIELRVDAEPARPLLERLARDPAVTGIAWAGTDCPPPITASEAVPDGRLVSGVHDDAAERHGAAVLTVRGTDLDALAVAVARSAVEVQSRVRSIVPVTPGLDEVRAASSGLALAAYHAAYAAYSEYAAPWVEAAARSRSQAAQGTPIGAAGAPPLASVGESGGPTGGSGAGR